MRATSGARTKIRSDLSSLDKTWYVYSLEHLTTSQQCAKGRVHNRFYVHRTGENVTAQKCLFWYKLVYTGP